MATYATAVLNGQLDWFDDQVNAGGGTGGFFKLLDATAGGAICSFDFNSTAAFSAAADQSMTADTIAAATILSAGTITAAGIYDTDDALLVTLTVDDSSADCVVTTLTPTSGASISISTFVVTI